MNNAQTLVQRLLKPKTKLPFAIGTYTAKQMITLRTSQVVKDDGIVIFDYNLPIAYVDVNGRKATAIIFSAACGRFVSMTTSKHCTQMLRSLHQEFDMNSCGCEDAGLSDVPHITTSNASVVVDKLIELHTQFFGA